MFVMPVVAAHASARGQGYIRDIYIYIISPLKFERETGGIRNMISKNPTCNDLETSIRSVCVPQIPRTHGFEDYVRTMPGGLATKNHH